MQAHLLRHGIKVTRKKLRQAIHQVDHDSTVARQSKVIQRRVYSVPDPNSVWHINTHQKLIQWRIILSVYDKNRAATSLQVFCDCLAKFG